MIRRVIKTGFVYLVCQLCVLLAIVGPAYLYYHFRDQAKAASINWGVTFSISQSQSLGLDWKANYLAILDDLHPSGIRLIAGWDTIEPNLQAWNDDDLDWEVAQADSRKVPIIIAIGQKVPRWPECHIPTWADNDANKRSQQLLDYERHVIGRYKNTGSLLYWQVENEPYLAFGACDQKDTGVIDREVALVHQLDPRHLVLMTDGGEWGAWYPAAARGDLFGTTMYRYVFDRRMNMEQQYYLPPEYYQAKADLTRLMTGKPNLKVIVSELGLEPWGNKQISDMTLTEQKNYLPLANLKETLNFAQQTGFDTYYLWGTEWWYYAKVHGAPEYWNEIQQVIRLNKI